MEPGTERHVRVVLCAPDGATTLAAVLNAQRGLTVGAIAPDAAAAVALLPRQQPDVLLVDTAIAAADLLSLCGLAGRNPASGVRGVVLLITEADDELLAAAIRRGARGLVTPDAPVEHIAGAISAVSSGGAYIAPPLAGRVLERSATSAARRCPPTPPRS